MKMAKMWICMKVHEDGWLQIKQHTCRNSSIFSVTRMPAWSIQKGAYRWWLRERRALACISRLIGQWVWTLINLPMSTASKVPSIAGHLTAGICIWSRGRLQAQCQLYLMLPFWCVANASCDHLANFVMSFAGESSSSHVNGCCQEERHVFAKWTHIAFSNLTAQIFLPSWHPVALVFLGHLLNAVFCVLSLRRKEDCWSLQADQELGRMIQLWMQECLQAVWHSKW